jgi:DNA-binding XRE family transcriptional regulator
MTVLDRVAETPAEQIRRVRLEAGLTQRELADRTGIARPNLSAIESGARTPSNEMFRRLLAGVYGEEALRPRRRLGYSQLLNIELHRLAAYAVMSNPQRALSVMQSAIAERRSADAHGNSSPWIERWESLIDRSDIDEIVAFLLSTDPDVVDQRKLSPCAAFVTADQREDILRRLAQVRRGPRSA